MIHGHYTKAVVKRVLRDRREETRRGTWRHVTHDRHAASADSCGEHPLPRSIDEEDARSRKVAGSREY